LSTTFFFVAHHRYIFPNASVGKFHFGDGKNQFILRLIRRKHATDQSESEQKRFHSAAISIPAADLNIIPSFLAPSVPFRGHPTLSFLACLRSQQQLQRDHPPP